MKTDEFEGFDPLFGHVPDSPFGLSNVAYRARQLLSGKTLDQIQEISREVSAVVDSYFSEALYKGAPDIFELDEDDTDYYFRWSEDNADAGFYCFREERAEELGISTPENTSEVYALKMAINSRDDFEINSQDRDIYISRDSYNHSMFAVLSLTMISRVLNNINSASFSSGWLLLDAMDAVCYAEHLHQINRLLIDLEAEHGRKVNDAIRQYNHERDELLQKERKEKSKKLNSIRHARTHEAKSMVLDDWENNPDRFSSAARAGSYYVDWLEEKKFYKDSSRAARETYQPLTITNWIREYAKNKGIKLR